MQVNYHLIFNRPNAARALDIAIEKIIRVERWLNCCWVIFSGGCRFISFIEFKKVFVEVRKLGGAKLHSNKKVTKTSKDTYLVESEKSTAFYYSVNLAECTCTCQDYLNQFGKFGKGRCKHIYAALVDRNG